MLNCGFSVAGMFLATTASLRGGSRSRSERTSQDVSAARSGSTSLPRSVHTRHHRKPPLSSRTDDKPTPWFFTQVINRDGSGSGMTDTFVQLDNGLVQLHSVDMH